MLYPAARSSADCKYNKKTCGHGQDPGTVSEISIYYHYMDEIFMIHRSTASELTKNSGGENVSLRTIMRIHTVKTVEPEVQKEDAVEFQWFYQLLARYDILFQTGLERTSLVNIPLQC